MIGNSLIRLMYYRALLAFSVTMEKRSLGNEQLIVTVEADDIKFSTQGLLIRLAHKENRNRRKEKKRASNVLFLIQTKRNT